MVLPYQITIHAQTDVWERYLHENTEQEDVERESWENTFNVMSELALHPININTATREDLERLPFLTAQQIEDICAYLYQYGPMRSLGELAMIESIDYEQRQLLERFIILGDNKEKAHFPSTQNILRYGKHELMATDNIPFYERRGDRNGYLGYKYKNWVRYQFTYSDYIKAGVLGSNDAGEPFFGSNNRMGYDFYSFYVTIRKLGILKALAVGRYRLRFGMGLVMNNDFGFGKIATLTSLGRNTNSIRAHSSRSESNYLQGAATTITIAKGVDLTGFVSYRNIDATLTKDGKAIQTIRTDGYHRTITEMTHKNNASQLVTGGNIHWFYNGFHLGATAIYTSFDKELQPDKQQLYRYYNPEGKSFYNMSIDYGYVSRKLSIHGETATGDSHAIATLNSISYLVRNHLSLLAVQRFYSYRYHSLFAESFSDGGSVNNESGVYIGANWQPSRKFSLSTYADYAYFAWQRYRQEAGTTRCDYYVAASYQPGDFSFYLRHRLHGKVHRSRLHAEYHHGKWGTKTQGDIGYTRNNGNDSFGWMISENLSFNQQWLRMNVGICYFDTDNYDSRIYTYEQGTLYNFAFTPFFGNGIRYYLHARADIGKHWMFICKFGTTKYFDRNQISSGYQQIDGSSQSNLEIQLRLKF